jgi:hypothetical protein
MSLVEAPPGGAVATVVVFNIVLLGTIRRNVIKKEYKS